MTISRLYLLAASYLLSDQLSFMNMISLKKFFQKYVCKRASVVFLTSGGREVMI